MATRHDHSYIYSHIDKTSPEINSYAQKFKTLRLSALSSSPSSFSSTYEVESQHFDQWWKDRLLAVGRETFVCVACPEGQMNDGEGEWVGQVTLLGPGTQSNWGLPKEADQPKLLPDEVQEKWQMLSLFTLSTYRGRGTGKRLCQAALQWLLESETRLEEGNEHEIAREVQVRIMIKPENTLVLKMYQDLGFVDYGRCTLAEALKANGDGDMIPVGGDDEKFHRRSGLIMALILHRG